MLWLSHNISVKIWQMWLAGKNPNFPFDCSLKEKQGQSFFGPTCPGDHRNALHSALLWPVFSQQCAKVFCLLTSLSWSKLWRDPEVRIPQIPGLTADSTSQHTDESLSQQLQLPPQPSTPACIGGGRAKSHWLTVTSFQFTEDWEPHTSVLICEHSSVVKVQLQSKHRWKIFQWGDRNKTPSDF